MAHVSYNLALVGYYPYQMPGFAVIVNKRATQWLLFRVHWVTSCTCNELCFVRTCNFFGHGPTMYPPLGLVSPNHKLGFCVIMKLFEIFIHNNTKTQFDLVGSVKRKVHCANDETFVLKPYNHIGKDQEVNPRGLGSGSLGTGPVQGSGPEPGVVPPNQLPGRDG